MDQPGAENIARSVGIIQNWDDLRSGEASITREQAFAIQRAMHPTFVASARNFAGTATWGLMTIDQRNALINVASNLGPGTLHRFDEMRDALREDPPNFVEAARQLMVDSGGVNPSAFATQLPNRSARAARRLAGTP